MPISPPDDYWSYARSHVSGRLGLTDLIRMSLILAVMLISGTIIIAIFASGTITAALTDLFRATRQVAEGQFDIRVNVKSNDEIGSLANSFNAMAKEVSDNHPLYVDKFLPDAVEFDAIPGVPAGRRRSASHG